MDKPKTRQDYIELSKPMIAKKMGLESFDKWTHSKYVLLAERIKVETNETISISTLKRLFGKIKYEGKANVSTYDTLARFLGYESWNQYIASFSGSTQSASNLDDDLEVVEKKQTIQKERGFGVSTNVILEKTKEETPIWRKPLFIVVTVTVVLCLAVVAFFFLGKKVNLRDEVVEFTSTVPISNVPFTSTFNIKTEGFENDSFILKLPTKDYPIKGGVENLPFTFVNPGLHYARLYTKDKRLLKSVEIHAKDENWRGMLGLKQNGKLEYILLSDTTTILKNDTLSFPVAIYENYNVKSLITYWTTFVYSNDLDIDLNDFEMELEVINNTYGGYHDMFSRDCQIKLIGKNERKIYLNFYKPGFSAWGYNEISEIVVSKDLQALRAFELDTDKWNKIKIIAKNNIVRIFVNDTERFQQSYTKDFGAFAELTFSFRGKGKIKLHYFKSKNKEYFERFIKK